ncbi:MAG: transcription termination/antitermination protein NusA [Parcubacteria group bacterium]|nr:transcription termination/antitermination protein NusA [Parcubacteria group bacterium]
MAILDLKALNVALDQLQGERGIPREKIIAAIEDALAAAYKKDYGKRGQVIRARFDSDTGSVEFSQVKTVVDEEQVRMPEEGEEEVDASPVGEFKKGRGLEAERTKDADEVVEGEETKIRYNPEQHLFLEEARRMKKDAGIGEEIIFPLESRDDYGRIAAQTAKQVIIQRIREAERTSAFEEFGKRRGEVVNGTVQRIERGTIFIDLGRTTGVLPRDEQIPGEYFRQGDRIRAYLYDIEEGARDITLRLSRSHPRFLHKLMEIEVPEIANGTVEVKGIVREPGSRSKVAVASNDDHIDPVGSCVGQRGVRITAVMNELGGEKIDIIEWSPQEEQFIARALSPADVLNVTLKSEERRAEIMVSPDQYSLAIGKGGQNARLAARLTGWRIDIKESTGKQETTSAPAEDAKAATEEAPQEAVKEEKTEEKGE